PGQARLDDDGHAALWPAVHRGDDRHDESPAAGAMAALGRSDVDRPGSRARGPRDHGQPPHTTAQTVSGTATVGAAESRTVTAGRFDTNQVTLTTSDGNTSKSYWSREAGNYVEQNSHDSSTRDTGSSQLTSYSYTAPPTLG